MQVVLYFIVCNVLATKRKGKKGRKKAAIHLISYPTSVSIILLKPHTLWKLEALLLEKIHSSYKYQLQDGIQPVNNVCSRRQIFPE